MNWHSLRKLIWRYDDAMAPLVRNRVPKHMGSEAQGLRPYQTYPHGGNLDHAFILDQASQFPKIIEPTTPITSMGSCFAVEIRRHFRTGGYAFFENADPLGCGEWGRVYTTKNMLQIFQYSFSEFDPAVRVARTSKGFVDPYRESEIFVSVKEAEESIAKHRIQSTNALSNCRVLILTPGQNEVWINRRDGLAWVHQPSPEALAEYGSDNFCLQRYSISENIDHLNSALRLLWENNPDVTVIFTVSPVPSAATYFDANVACQSFENKAILLLAVKEVVNQHPDRTFYFPSFEMAMLSHNPNLMRDNRHVRPRVVEKIMSSFDKCFVADR